MAVTTWQGSGFACKTCGLGLQQWPDGGHEVLVHTRPWEEHDHDPVPIPMHQATNRVLVCDFCSNTGATWLYHGDSMKMAGSIGGRWEYAGEDVDGVWSACDGCDPFARRGDVEGIWVSYEAARTPEFVAAMEKAMPGMSNRDRAEVKVRQIALWRQFLATVRRREKIQPLAPLPVIRPAAMPKIRDRLVELWKTPIIGHALRADIDSGGYVALPGIDYGKPDVFVEEVTELDDETVNRFRDRVIRNLLVGDLLWISPEFTHTAVTAGKKLPDASVMREDLPANSGLIIWETPIGEISTSASPIPMPITAASWSLVPHGVWFVLYGPPEQVIGSGSPEAIRKALGWLMPWSAGGGTTFGEDLPDQMTFLRTLVATWLLIKQPGMAEQTEEQVHADIRRAYRKTNRREPKVHVVSVRHAARQARPNGEQATRNYTKGWMVGWSTGGFWRDYWTGPGRGTRERRFIKPYRARGDLPMTAEQNPVPTVKVLR